MESFKGKPVLWINLPCSIEPVQYRLGCGIINWALAAAPRRWPNLTVLDWARAAVGHPEYMGPGEDAVHYSLLGYAVNANMVLAALEARMPDAG
jgi:hypothetical protein